MDNRSENHFSNPKKPHTQIKHRIFQETLKISLSIANQLTTSYYKSNSSISRTYTYTDLFSGSGIFADGTKGSPMLAFNIFSSHLETKNNFDLLRIICTDKEKINIEQLTNEFNKGIYENKIAEQIQFFTGIGDWEQYKHDIKNKLTESGWGFVFADPFSTELDLKEMVIMLEKCSKLKDILVFFNYNTLARQDGRRCKTDIERICKTVNLTKEEMLDEKKQDFSEIFKTRIKETFSHIKKMVKGVSFPVAKEGKLTNADYFYLIFATDSLILTDKFLECYREILASHKNTQLSIDDFCDELVFEDNIKENIKQKQEIYFYDLYNELTSDFLSWKSFSSNTRTIPTRENIIRIINKLTRNNIIKVGCGGEFLYKRVTGSNIIGDIKLSGIKSTEDTKEIKLKYISGC